MSVSFNVLKSLIIFSCDKSQYGGEQVDHLHKTNEQKKQRGIFEWFIFCKYSYRCEGRD